MPSWNQMKQLWLSSCFKTLFISRLWILLSQNNTAEVGIAKTHSITVNGHNSS
ncbi:unnamed protein product [Musa hybrid cultivar]